MEFDIDTLPIKTARELELYVKNKVADLNKKKNLTKKPTFYNPAAQTSGFSSNKDTNQSLLPTNLSSEVRG